MTTVELARIDREMGRGDGRARGRHRSAFPQIGTVATGVAAVALIGPR